MANQGAIGWGFLHTCEIGVLPGLPVQINRIGFNPNCQRFLAAFNILGISTDSAINHTGQTQAALMDPLNGYVAGYLYTDSTKTAPVANQPIYLISRETRQLVGVEFTNSTGYYEFDQLPASLHYIVLTPGYNSTVNGLVADNITRGVH